MTANRLRKFAAIILCALFCIIGSALTAGAAQRYTINEIDDMVIYLPDDMSAITRSSKNTDRYFSVFGLDYNTTMKNFENGDIYLQGMDSLSAVTVTVTMTKTSESQGIGNYNLLESDKLSQVSSNFLNQNEYTSCTPDSTGKIVWLNFDTNVTSNGLSIKAYQANTVYDGMSVSITLQRNSGNVTAEDYATFTEIVSSVSFLKEGSTATIIPYIIIGAAVIVILLIILIIILTKRAKKRRKKNKNDRIIEELAGKYTSKRKGNDKQQPDYSVYEDENFEDDKNNNDILDISSSHEDDSTDDYFIDKTEIDSDDFFRGVEQSGNEDVKIYDPSNNKSDDKEIEEILNYKRIADEEAAAEESTAEVVYSSPKSKQEIKAQNDEVESEIDDVEDEPSPVKPDKISELGDEIFGKADESDDEDYNNDEELVRQEAKRTKFDDSDDFFEEAPKKTMGVISSREIRDAEDFDVINEVEKRVSEVEKPMSNAGDTFISVIKNIGGGIKSFGIHFGYFCTNVSRMIKRRHAMKKRQKVEAERRERARQRAEKQRAQRREMEDGGLVRVHSRSDQRTVQNRRGSQQRRPSNTQNRNGYSSRPRR